MTALTTDLSDPLLDLLRQEPGCVDGVEIGPWYSPGQVRRYRQELAAPPLALTFYLHAADMIHKVGLRPGGVGAIQTYLQISGSPWVSLHLSAWLPGWLRRFLARGWPGPRPPPALDARRLVWQVRRVARAVQAPILLENVEPLEWPGYAYYSEPAWINRILAETGCALLLDTGHARVAAAAFGLDPVEYINRLPVEQAAQVHVSGPREREGRLFDAHEPLREEDYCLLEYVLSRSHPQVVTLEYIRESAALQDQLKRLRELVKG